MRSHIALLSAAIALSIAPFSGAGAQESSSEIAKDGSCPTGFKASGSLCQSSSKVAIVRLGSCPTGFKASGNYCVGDKGSYAEVRSGSCPTGLKTSGKYCIRS